MIQIRIAMLCVLLSLLCFTLGCEMRDSEMPTAMIGTRMLLTHMDETPYAATEPKTRDALTEEECTAVTEELVIMKDGILRDAMGAAYFAAMSTAETALSAESVPDDSTSDTFHEPAPNDIMVSPEGGIEAYNAYQSALDLEEKQEQTQAELANRKEAERILREQEERAEQQRRAAQRREAEEKAAAKKEAALKAACPGYNPDYVALLTEEEQKQMRTFYEEGYVFYRQNCEMLKELPYGDEGFGQCGCGPTVTAALIANLAGVPVTPEDMRVHALDTHAYIPNVGTTYNFILTTTAAYGIKATNVSSKEAVCDALRQGKLVLATMGPGDFTLGAHFMLYRGITDDGKILIADSYSYDFSRQEWDWDTLAGQLKNGYWVFELEKKN